MQKICPQCGMPLTPTQKFCTSCGMQFTGMAGQGQHPEILDPVKSSSYGSSPTTIDPYSAPEYHSETVVINDSSDWDNAVSESTSTLDPSATVLEDFAQPTYIEDEPLPSFEPNSEPESKYEPAVVEISINDVAGGAHTYTLDLGADTQILVGRDGRAVTVKTEDPRSSRQHFTVTLGNGEFILTDLDSSNGTFVNGLRVAEPARLMDGDKVAFGRSEAVFRLVSPPSAWPSGESASSL